MDSEYSVEYPFCRDKAHICDEDDYVEIDTWRPGIKFINGPDSCREDPYTIPVADAHGKMLLTIVDTYKPGRFPTRVFFTRRWEDPDGKVFGKTRLHITTLQQFNRMVRGYRHPYTCGESP